MAAAPVGIGGAVMAAGKAATDFDVVVVGGGPTGAIAGLVLARAWVSVAVVEKATFPRFQIGESFLPVTLEQMERLGLMEPLRRLPHMPKYGAEFGMGDAEDTSVFHFNEGLVGGENETFNIARADFDAMVLEQAKAAGAAVLQPVGVRGIDRLADGDAAVRTEDGTITARYLIDASGAATLVGRHLGTRRRLASGHLQKVAYFEHFEGVQRLEGRSAGYPLVAMAEEGWFWVIPLDETRTSVGFVLNPAVARSVDVPADRMLAWGISRCPLMRRRMAEAAGPARNRVRGDFSYRCRPMAGPGYFLAGDAGTFIDPVFSTGVCLGMVGGERAAMAVIDVLRGQVRPETARRRYTRYMEGATRRFTRLIGYYYRHSFRELFLHGSGPAQMQRSVLALLTGHVFRGLPWKVWWRFVLFEGCVRLQRRLELVPRRQQFSLLQEKPEPWQPKPATARHAESRTRYESV